MSSASAAKSAERIDGAIFTLPLYRSLATQAHGCETVGAVPMGTAPEHAVTVEGQGKRGRRLGEKVRARREECDDDVLVLLGLERARRVDESAAGLDHLGRRGEDGQ